MISEHWTHISYMGLGGAAHLDTWYGKAALLCCILMILVAALGGSVQEE
jgi:hypothetical protein